MTTAKQHLDVIKSYAFKDEEVGGNIIYHAERLMDRKQSLVPARWLGDQFWTCDEGRIPMYEDNPFTDQEQLGTLTEKEQKEVRFILKLAGLCHDIANNFPCDLSLVIPNFESNEDWSKDFSIENTALTEFLEYAEFRIFSAYLSWNMVLVKTGEVKKGNHVYQDFLAVLDHKFNEFEHFEITPDEFIDICIESLKRLKRHDDKGKEMGLTAEELAVNDMLQGLFIDRISEAHASVAKEFVAYINRQLDIVPDMDSFGRDAYGKLLETCKEHEVDFGNDPVAVSYLETYISNQYHKMYGDAE